MKTMNKNWILTTLILYLVTITILGGMLLNRKPTTFSAQPTAEQNDKPPRISSRKQLAKNCDLIAEHDLFHPARGKEINDEDNAVNNHNNPRRAPGRFRFNLLGVFRSEDKHGALIVVSGNMPGDNASLKKADSDIYFQGAEITEGYILQKVDSTNVTILQHGEAVVVEMEKFAPPQNEPNKPAIRARTTRRGRIHARK